MKFEQKEMPYVVGFWAESPGEAERDLNAKFPGAYDIEWES